jgi:DHA1 family inner membrane transport protein
MSNRDLIGAALAEGLNRPQPLAATKHDQARGFTRTQIAAVMLVSVIASLVGALQPLLLGPLASAGRLTLAEMGRTAMLEALGMALAVAGAGAFLKPQRLRTMIVIAATVSALANGLTMVGQHEVVLLARFTTGLGAGVMLWVWTGMLTRVALPARLVAIFVTLQSVGALVLSWVFSAIVMPRFGASGGYACLMFGSAASALLAFAAPKAYEALAGNTDSGFRAPSGRGLAGLLAVLLHQAAIMAFWVYVLPLGRDKGLSDGFVALTVSLGLAAQVAGGLSATFLAKLDARIALYASIAGSLAALWLIGFGAGTIAFAVGVVVIAFFWMFAPAYQMPYLLATDPSKRAAMQMISAQLLGLSSGPALVSFVVADNGTAGATEVSAGLFVVAAVLIALTTHVTRRGRSTVKAT